MENVSVNDSEVRHARHNLRGRLNALKLCVSAFEILNTVKDELEFLHLIEQSADGTVVALDEMERVYDRAGVPRTD